MAGETLVLRMALIAVIGLIATAAAGQTVVLQQGVKGYDGCTARALPGAMPKASGGVLPLRGSKNRLEIRFEMPADSAKRTLARARLAVFLPAAREPNTFTEIFCHAAGGDGPVIDEKTDFDNGRRPGAVDSVELFAPAGKSWLDYPWLPRGVPAGGKWIEFNVTALARRWLADPKSNRGVLLDPTDCPDKRFPSTWEIDIPSANAADAKHRPKLILEFAPPAEDVLIGTTHGMERILDRSTRFGYRGRYRKDYALSMAGNEFEGFQIVVYPMLADLADVTLAVGDLAGPDGAKIPAADIECFRVDWYKLRANWKTRDRFFRGKLYDSPDPLVPLTTTTARRHMHTPLFVRVRTRTDTPAGAYRGTIAVRAGRRKIADVTLTVNVWPFAIPERWNFHTMGQFIMENCRKFHGKDWNETLRRRYFDFLLDHRFAPTEQYRQALSPRVDLEHCLDRGMNTIYLYSVHGSRDKPTVALMEKLKANYEKLRKMKRLDFAIIYIGDETSKWAKMHSYADLTHAYLPGVQVMIGGSFPREELTGYIDVYDPQIGGRSKTFSLSEASAPLIAESQKRGEEFYWYVAAGPAYPFPNVQVEYPVSDSRALFWMTWKYGVTGFEYYCYNIWHGRNFSADPAKRFPAVRWQADGWEKGWPSNGDGMLFYPGPTTSLRFEAIRDGIEDWEMLQVLRDCVSAVRRRKRAGKHKALLAEAEKLLAVRGEIVKGFQEFTRDPEQLLAERQAVGDLLAKLVPIVHKTEKWDTHSMRLDRAAEVRIARVTAARRKMLRARHLQACERLKVKPLTDDEWAGLWPKRVLFAQDFESAPGDFEWDGEIEATNVPSGSKRALAGKGGNKWFAQRTRTGIYFNNARAATTTWVSFRYFINEPVPIGVFVFDMNQSDNWSYTIDKPVVGKWTEVTLNVTRDFRKKGGGNAKIRAGDALDDVFVHAGKPGDKLLKLIVDDVKLIGLD